MPLPSILSPTSKIRPANCSRLPWKLIRPPSMVRVPGSPKPVILSTSLVGDSVRNRTFSVIGSLIGFAGLESDYRVSPRRFIGGQNPDQPRTPATNGGIINPRSQDRVLLAGLLAGRGRELPSAE